MRDGRVGFMIAGVQKAGTSSLFSYLTRHPDLQGPSVKETHFFDDETGVDWAKPDYERLHRLFPATDGDDRIAFEATPISIFWPNALERIVAYSPDMRLILIFRDPIERAWSHWRMEIERGADNVPFGFAIRQGRWRLRDVAPNDPAWRTYSYVERGFYGRQIDRLLGLFDRQNVLFLRSNDLKRDPAATLASIAAFLELRPFPPGKPIIQHVGESDFGRLSEVDFRYLKSLYADDLEAFAKTSGIQVDDWPTWHSMSYEATS
ncbi:sulfotransferase domain-containing protein [Mesorhizobium sp. M0293]|uniref:sulfotransferase family protein n=1 Tax=Mesorhizobium sp. M0293 TaxID=2956930 RepID=UPI0033398350